jgi:hypothetical protein
LSTFFFIFLFFAEFSGRQISFLALDVSSAGEAAYLLRHIQYRGDNFFSKYRRLIVDIGANDGLMASNSFNLIQLGWDAILVEPQQELLHQAQENIEKYYTFILFILKGLLI